jgi:hypothetical protein
MCPSWSYHFVVPQEVLDFCCNVLCARISCSVLYCSWQLPKFRTKISNSPV